MKKNLLIVFMCALMVFIAVSCEEPHTHSYEVVKDGEKLVKKCTACGNVSSEAVTGTLVLTADELKKALNEDATTIYLGADITIDSAIEFTKSLIIDLNDKELNLGENKITNSGSVTFKNGNVISEMDSTGNDNVILSNGVIAFENVSFKHEGKAWGILFVSGGELSIIGSTFRGYARDSIISSYADPAAKIEGSMIINNYKKTTDDTITPYAIAALGGEFNIKNSTIKGSGDGTQGLLAYGATVNISNNSKIESSSDALDIDSKTWTYGGQTYVDKTSVTVENSSVTSTSGYGINILATGAGTKANLTIKNSTVNPSENQIKAEAYKGGKVGIVGMNWDTVYAGTSSDEASKISIGALVE